MLSWGPTYLTIDLIVEIFSKRGLWAGVRGIAGRTDKLLQLDSSDEILVLRAHETVAFGQQEDLVIALSTLSIFL